MLLLLTACEKCTVELNKWKIFGNVHFKKKTRSHAMFSTGSETEIGLDGIYMVRSHSWSPFPTAVNWLKIHLGDIKQMITKGWHSPGPL